MQCLNLDVAGEFFVMAATPGHIKTPMLLPAGGGKSGEDEEEGDSRGGLIRPVVGYQRLQNAAAPLGQRENFGGRRFFRLGSPTEEVPVPNLREVSVFELLTALRRVLERLPKDNVHEVTLDKITVREKMTLLLDTLRAQSGVLFDSLFATVKTRMEVVVT